MIEESNVFILGAGASVPYGHPSGYVLQKMIYDHLGEKIRKQDNELNRLGFDFELLEKFRTSLIASNLQSIDFFLKNRPEFMSLGKTCIARILMQFEDSTKIISFENQWLRYFWSLIINDATIESFRKNNITFITFNYDRSLEYFFFQSIKNTFGKDDEETLSLLKHIPIIHIHGKLGNLPWESITKYRSYSTSLGTYNNLKELSNEIKIIYENSHDSEDVKKAKELLKEAKNIHFLGFGYHKLNLDLLNIGDLDNDKRIRGTTFGLSDRERIRIVKFNPAKLHMIDNLRNTIYDYLRNTDIF